MRQGEVAAIVSDAPEGLRPKRRDLLAHQRVPDEAGTLGVVLPMRCAGVASARDEGGTAAAFGNAAAQPNG